MLSGMLEQLSGAYPALLFLVILAGHHSCSATTNCAPSSCGITQISSPFRLQTDPISCGRKEYELGCENNRTTLYLQSVKYYVQAIDYYPAFTIRLVEADFQKHGCLSIPRHSLRLQRSSFDYGHYYPFSDHLFSRNPNRFSHSSIYFALAFISCPSPKPSPPYFVNTSSCKNDSIYSYVAVSNVQIAEVPDLCCIDLTYATVFSENNTIMSSISQQWENITNMSNIHDFLAYGFELSWFEAACDYAKENHINLDNATTRYSYNCGDTHRNSAPIRAAIGKQLLRIVNCFYRSTHWIELGNMK